VSFEDLAKKLLDGIFSLYVLVDARLGYNVHINQPVGWMIKASIKTL